MATTAAPIARNIRSRLRLSAAELGGLRKRTLIAKVDILPVQSCHGLISEIPKLHLDNSGAVPCTHFPVVCVLRVSACALVCPVGTHTGDGTHGRRTSQPSTQTQRHTRTTTRRPKPRPTQQPQEQPQARIRLFTGKEFLQ